MPATTPAAIARAVTGAVTAARAQDEPAFTEAALTAAALDQTALSLVQAGLIRQLLELLHPDGLDGDDVQAALTQTVTETAWCPAVSPDEVALVLIGALGLTGTDSDRQPHQLCRPAFLVIATLLAGVPDQFEAGPDLLTELVAAQLREIERAETMEQP